MLDQHLSLYGRAVDRLNAIQTSYPLTAEPARGPATSTLLAFPVRHLELSIAPAVGPLKDALALVQLEFTYKTPAPAFWPTWYLGTEDFWTSDKSVRINVPWFLATAELWRLASRTQEFAYAFDQVLRCLRHELGHAVFFGYELGANPLWLAAFGDPTIPYPQRDDTLEPNTSSRGFVEYLTYAPAHYAQKHPEEAWAEAFGRWLDSGAPDWRAEYAAWPEALAKLEAVDIIMQSLGGKAATNIYQGRPDPYTTLRGTVADRLGMPRAVQPFSGMGWAEHGELLRSEPSAYNAVTLHEFYFEQFTSVPGHPLPVFLQAVERSWGSWENFTRDLRAACGSTDGWVLVVWDLVERRPRVNLVEKHADGVMAGCPVLLAIDCWEHAYAADYGTRKDLYLAAVFRGMNWVVVESRLVRIGAAVHVHAEPVRSVVETTTPGDVPSVTMPGVARMAGRENLVLVERERKIGDKSHQWHYWVSEEDVKDSDHVIDKGIAKLEFVAPVKAEPLKEGEKGVSVTQRLHFPDGSQAYYKPATGEPRMRPDVTPGTSYKREVAAYALSQVLGLGHMVPPTVVREDLPEGIGSVQAAHQPKGLPKELTAALQERYNANAAKFGVKPADVEKTLTANAHARAQEGIQDDPVGFQKMRAFDLIIGNTDRHSRNWMPSYEGKTRTPLLIDHGLAFPTSIVPSHMAKLPRVDRHVEGPLHPEVSKMIEHADTHQIASTLKAHGLEPEAIHGVIVRLEALKANPRMVEFHGEEGSFKFSHESPELDLGKDTQRTVQAVMAEVAPSWSPRPKDIPYSKLVPWSGSDSEEGTVRTK
jgi:hypothetical protein